MFIKFSISLIMATATLFLSPTSYAGSREDTTNAILSGEKGGILMYTKGCGFSFKNKTTGEVVYYKGRKNFGIVAVPAGMYDYNYIGCEQQIRDKLYRFKEKNPERWFEPIEVVAGEVIYPGSVYGSLMYYKPKGAIQIENPFKTPVEHFPNYSTYNVNKVTKKLKKKYPKLLDKVTTNRPKPLRDAKVIKQIINDNYAPKENGEKVKIKTANMRARWQYNVYIKTGKSPFTKSVSEAKPDGEAK